MNSLKRIQGLKPSVIYPGHGPLITDGVNRIEQYIEHRNKRNIQIVQALEKNNVAMEPEELVKEIYIVR